MTIIYLDFKDKAVGQVRCNKQGPRRMAQYHKIESIGSIGSVILDISEVQVGVSENQRHQLQTQTSRTPRIRTPQIGPQMIETARNSHDQISS